MPSMSCFYGGTIAAGTITGGDRHGLEVWSAWAQRDDCDLTVFTSFLGAELIHKFGYDLRVVISEPAPSTIGVSRLGYIHRFANQLRSALKAPVTNIVYSASPYFYDLIPSMVLKGRSPKSKLIIALFHLIPPPWKRNGSAIINTIAWLEQRLMVLLARRFADRIVVDNAELVNDLAAMGVTRSRIILSPMGIRQVCARKTGNGSRFQSIYVGRLAAPKGVPGLISSWRRVVNALPHARLALVGNNEVGFDAQRAVQEAGLDASISVFSGLSDEEVRGMLDQSDTFITGSLEEGYGLSVLEALAAGLPCITFDIPAFKYAFPVGRYPAVRFQYDALADAAIELLSNDALRSELKSRIAEGVDVKTWPTVAKELWSATIER